MAERLLVGAVVGAQGLCGLLRVKSFTHNPEDLAAYGPVEMEAADGTVTRVTLKVTGTAKGLMIVRAGGIADRTRAEALKGARFFVDRAALPAVEDDEFYTDDLIGLMAERADGTRIGRVKAVYDFGAGDVIEIEGPGGGLMLPFTQDTVPEVDLDGGRIMVVPPVMTGSAADRDAEAAEDQQREAAHDGHG
jgi:16S rRNA processing protein RimM